MYIHKEGIPTISLAGMFCLLVNAIPRWAAPQLQWLHILALMLSLALMYIVLQFFRNPKRKTILNENDVIAPADGRVVVIEEVFEDEYLKDKRLQISIFMSPFNVHVNRNPCSGIISYFKYHPGKYLVAWHPKSSTENERTTCVVKKENGVEVLYRQIAGALARRIVWYVKEQQKVKQGEEFGFIKFGSRVDIFLPLDAKVNVKIGDITKGGESVIAQF
ncbi:MAG: phosphatidylserine decarboxylase family protein [Cytophagales bacterium]